jgi:FtsP/CotA-like multicopper oxidase with cupredoxin domain
MYRTIFGEKVSKARWKQMLNAQKNRQEIIRAGLSRRELFRLGLLTGAGYLVAKSGLSAWAAECGPGQCQLGCSPATTPFLDPLPIMPVLPERALADPGFSPPPQECPNNAGNPATGLPFEGRGQFNGVLQPGTDCFQFFQRFPPQKFFISRMRENANFSITSDPGIPNQTIWGFNQGGEDPLTDPAIFPAPTVVSRYQTPILIRRFNELPPQNQNGGFGVPETSTHLHNFHSAPESDGGPCRFFFRGQYYDYYHTMQQAGFDADFPPNGDVRESLSTLWYHDHRIDHTAENVYKGLAGFQLIFNEFDTGDESTGFHLPGHLNPDGTPKFDFDIPLFLTDKLIDPGTGQICFDTFGLDGLVGDKFLVNGKVQPFFEVNKRRYRFRVLDGGPSRFYEIFVTNPDNPSQVIPFWVIANDGNLLPKPVQVTSFRLSVAERYDIIIDFNKIARDFGATRLWLENRLKQVNGRAPTDKILPAGQIQNALVELRIVGNPVADGSVDPAAGPQFYALPSNSDNDPNAQPRITRTFKFDRSNGQWAINNRFMDCNEIRFTVQRNSIEKWILLNNSGGWQHPIHNHLEEFQILSTNGVRTPDGSVERSRKDVVRLGFNDRRDLFFRFRDFRNDYPLHCHNTIHEDHAMMLRFDVQDTGDSNTRP